MFLSILSISRECVVPLFTTFFCLTGPSEREILGINVVRCGDEVGRHICRDMDANVDFIASKLAIAMFGAYVALFLHGYDCHDC